MPKAYPSDDAAWCWNVVHEGSFREECAELFQYLASKSATSDVVVDPVGSVSQFSSLAVMADEYSTGVAGRLLLGKAIRKHAHLPVYGWTERCDVPCFMSSSANRKGRVRYPSWLVGEIVKYGSCAASGTTIGLSCSHLAMIVTCNTDARPQVLAWGMGGLTAANKTSPGLGASHSTCQLPGQLKSLSPLEQKQNCEKWLEASQQALTASKWMQNPQVRALQAMCLNIAYRRPIFTSGAGVSLWTTMHAVGGKEASTAYQVSSAFFLSVSTVVRLAQLLGLHRLGTDSSIMPRPDPAWPQVACSLRRELAKRLWAFVVILDWYYCAPKGVAMITEGSCRAKNRVSRGICSELTCCVSDVSQSIQIGR